MEQKKSIGERIAKYLTVMLFVLTVGYVGIRYLEHHAKHLDMEIAATPIDILEVKPVGKLYVYTTEMEDYYMDVVENVGLFTKDYLRCAQIVRQQISWVVDLDQVEYSVVENSDTVHVKMPRPRFDEPKTHGAWFFSPIEKEDYDDNQLIGIVKKKIKNKYYKAEYEEIANQKAQKIIGDFVKACNKEPIFD